MNDVNVRNDGYRADPEGLMSKGRRITEIYEGYVAQKNIIYRTADRVASAWTGADSDKYVSAIHNYDEDFKKLGVVLAQMGDILSRHGARLADSRDAIQQIASRL